MILKYFAIHIEQPNKDCLYNAYKYGDICRGMCYFIQSSTEPLFVKKKKNTYTSKDISFSIPFFYFEIVPQDISERTALISVNIPRSEFFVQKHVTVRFAITF